MWISQGKYMSDCVRLNQERAGFMTSMFWTTVNGSQIFSFLFNSVILGNFEPQVLFILTSLISLVGIFIFSILPEPESDVSIISKPENPG